MDLSAEFKAAVKKRDPELRACWEWIANHEGGEQLDALIDTSFVDEIRCHTLGSLGAISHVCWVDVNSEFPKRSYQGSAISPTLSASASFLATQRALAFAALGERPRETLEAWEMVRAA